MDNTKKQITPTSTVRQRLTVEIPVGSLIRALEFVAAGLYASVDDVVVDGIETLRKDTAGSTIRTSRVAENVSLQPGSGPQPLDLAWNPSSPSWSYPTLPLLM